jgi:hypothetical protein
MKRTIEIAASFTGTIPTGSYENEKPFYSIKEVIEMDMDLKECPTDESLKDRQKELHQICYDQFKQQAEVSYIEKIAKAFQNLRFYDGENGLKYPSSTSVIGWDDDFHVSPDHLAQYGARGTIIHKQVEIFLSTGKLKDPKDIPEIYPELVILSRGDLNLEIDNVDFEAFFKNYPIKVIELEKTVLNHEHRYGGRLDILCVIESSNKGKWDKVEGCLFDVPTILDVKTGTIDKTRGFKQQTSYSKCDPEVKQMGLIHLNKEVKQGYSKPILEQNMDKYWTLFLKDRDNFKKRYGI